MSVDCELLQDFDPLLQSTSSQVSSNPSSNPSINPSINLSSNPSSGSSSNPSSGPSSGPSPPALTNDNDVELVVTDPSPDTTPPQPRNSPFHAADNFNPFTASDQHTSSDEGDVPMANKVPTKQSTSGTFGSKGFKKQVTLDALEHKELIDLRDKRLMKHCISDTNLNKLKQEYTPMPIGGPMESPLMTRSQEDLTATTGEPSPRHCVAKSPLAPGYSPRMARKQQEDQLSRSLFFFKLEDNDWVNLGDDFKASDIPDREVRSRDASPTQQSKRGGLRYGTKHKLEFLNPSGIKAIASKANMRSPELSGKHNRKLNRSRERSKSAAIQPLQSISKSISKSSSQWVNRYKV